LTLGVVENCGRIESCEEVVFRGRKTDFGDSNKYLADSYAVSDDGGAKVSNDAEGAIAPSKVESRFSMNFGYWEWKKGIHLVSTILEHGRRWLIQGVLRRRMGIWGGTRGCEQEVVR
jgi:hypothetical protein